MSIMLSSNAFVSVAQRFRDDRERDARHRESRAISMPENVKSRPFNPRLEACFGHGPDLVRRPQRPAVLVQENRVLQAFARDLPCEEAQTSSVRWM